MAVGDVERKQPRVSELVEIEAQGFAGQEVARDGVRAERVENDQAVVSIRSGGEGAPGISKNHPDRGRAGLEKREVSRVAGDPQDGGVDLIERELLPRPPVTRQGAGPEPDDPPGRAAP